MSGFCTVSSLREVINQSLAIFTIQLLTDNDRLNDKLLFLISKGRKEGSSLLFTSVKKSATLVRYMFCFAD